MSRTNTKKSQKMGKKSCTRGWRGFVLKVGLIIITYFVFYVAYLDGKIRQKMDGQIWTLPAEVYSRIETVSVADNLSLNQIHQWLLNYGYRQTLKLGLPGDFKIESSTLTLIRRAFPFPLQPESQRVLRLRFSQDHKLQSIEDLVVGKRITSFKMDPKLIAMFQSNNEERLAIRLQQYPRLLIDALILTEDKRYFKHDGISLIGIGRALVSNLQAGRTVQGGSTLTQQLVKNLFLTNERSYRRKINEILMALILEARYSKNQILETYLNEVYLGQNGDTAIHGFALASQFFFGRPIEELSLDQIALLVGMVKGPSLYNPWRHAQNAINRRNVVLQLMRENHMIDDALYLMLSRRPLGLQSQRGINSHYPAFLQTVQRELKHQLGESQVHQLSGARIFTTLDPIQQQMAENAVVSAVTEIEKQRKLKQLQAAMIVANYHSGEIRAIVGGVQPQFAGFNRAINAQRQIGSLVKPSIYLTALSHPARFQLNTLLDNQPISIKMSGSSDWQPRNYNRRYGAPVMLLDALANSLNIPTVNLGMQLGLSQVIKTQQAMGWDQIQIPEMPSTLLGAYTISPYHVTQSFQVIANVGAKLPLTTLNVVTDRQNQVIYQNVVQEKQVVLREASIQTLYAMQKVVERGTGKRLNSHYSTLHLAGKTGTSNDARDTWFVGIDGENVSTVWLGKDDNTNTRLTGSSGALVIYEHYLKQNPLVTPFVLPSSQRLRWIGMDALGHWDCRSNNKIPVWGVANTLCQEAVSMDSTLPAPKRESPFYDTPIEEARPSIWEALNL